MALLLDDSDRPGRRRSDACERDQQRRRMSRCVARGPIAQAAAPRRNRHAIQPRLQIGAQRGDVRIPFGGIGADAAQRDRIQIALQRARQRLRVADAAQACRFGRACQRQRAGRTRRLGIDRRHRDRGHRDRRHPDQRRRLAGPRVAHQPIQQHAQRVDVDRDAGRRAAEHFRRRIRRADADPRRAGVLLRRQQRRQAEIEHPHRAFLRDQKIGRLDVLMQHAMRVRMLEGAARFDHQHRPRAQIGALRVAPAVDVLAVDALHRQPRLAVGGDARVQQRDDAGMFEAGEMIPLATERLQHRGRHQPGADGLDRDAALVQAVGAMRRIHHAHAAGLDHLVHAPRTEPRAAAPDRTGVVAHPGRIARIARGHPLQRRHQGVLAGIRPQQRRQGRAQIGIPRPQRIQRRRQFRFRHVRIPVEQIQRPGHDPVVGRHRCPERMPPLPASVMNGIACASPNCVKRNARALRQSRRNVRSVTPSTSAISASSRPPK